MTDPLHALVPPALHDALAQRPDDADLRAIWHALPMPDTAADDDVARVRRNVAWRRLSDRILDPSREPSPAVDEPSPFSLLSSANEADAVDDAPPILSPVATARLADRANGSARSLAWRAAAALLLVVGGAAAWRAVPEQFAVAAGAAPATRTLADGSRVTLAPGAQLSMARDFRRWYGATAPARTVHLTGEAFFDVARDGRPFLVETGDATVRVLGTHFDVRSSSALAGTRVVVEEGRVSVRGRETTVALTLAAGDAATIGANGSAQPLAALNVARATSWRTGGLAAIDEPLGDVLAEVARRTGVEITLDRDVAADSTVTLFYATTPPAERVLADLSAARALHFTRTSRGFRVSAGAAAR